MPSLAAVTELFGAFNNNNNFKIGQKTWDWVMHALSKLALTSLNTCISARMGTFYTST